MYVRVISFGTNWWMMHPTDTDNPYCFRQSLACFNSSALKSGRRLHHSAIFPGQIRFNAQSGFDPEFPSRAIGKTFLCSGPNQFEGKVHLLFQRLMKDVAPDWYLVALNSAEHGLIRFRKPGWMSSGVKPISISMRGSRFEAMLLIRIDDWIESDLGRWCLNANGSGLSLSCSQNGEFS
jgi:hypothetical protein